MARTEAVIEAPPQAVYDILSDPRSYAYWVLGSIQVRDADESWPLPGSEFRHTIGIGPLRIHDRTVVEEVVPGSFLQLETKGGPLGNARVKLTLEPVPEGTRVTMTEEPADAPSAYVFLPLTHLLIKARNLRGLARLAELAEGRRPVPGTEDGAPVRELTGEAPVINPKGSAHPAGMPGALTSIRRGALAGIAGAAAMSISTNAEMRFRGRPPSYAPAEAIGRLLGIHARTERSKKLLGLGGHLAAALSVGAARGLLSRAGLGPAGGGVALFGLALAPEIVLVPALGAAQPPWCWSRADIAVSALHHAVFAAAASVAFEAIRARAQ